VQTGSLQRPSPHIRPSGHSTSSPQGSSTHVPSSQSPNGHWSCVSHAIGDRLEASLVGFPMNDRDDCVRMSDVSEAVLPPDCPEPWDASDRSEAPEPNDP
jgi:hypothetical protein